MRPAPLGSWPLTTPQVQPRRPGYTHPHARPNTWLSLPPPDHAAHPRGSPECPPAHRGTRLPTPGSLSLAAQCSPLLPAALAQTLKVQPLQQTLAWPLPQPGSQKHPPTSDPSLLSASHPHGDGGEGGQRRRGTQAEERPAQGFPSSAGYCQHCPRPCLPPGVRSETKVCLSATPPPVHLPGPDWARAGSLSLLGWLSILPERLAQPLHCSPMLGTRGAHIHTFSGKRGGKGSGREVSRAWAPLPPPQALPRQHLTLLTRSHARQGGCRLFGGWAPPSKHCSSGGRPWWTSSFPRPVPGGGQEWMDTWSLGGVRPEGSKPHTCQ